jgi:hypothetical protein
VTYRRGGDRPCRFGVDRRVGVTINVPLKPTEQLPIGSLAHLRQLAKPANRTLIDGAICRVRVVSEGPPPAIAPSRGEQRRFLHRLVENAQSPDLAALCGCGLPSELAEARRQHETTLAELKQARESERGAWVAA